MTIAPQFQALTIACMIYTTMNQQVIWQTYLIGMITSFEIDKQKKFTVTFAGFDQLSKDITKGIIPKSYINYIMRYSYYYPFA
jgi:hypothetical protein